MKKMLISFIVAIMMVFVLATIIYAASQTVHITVGQGPVQSAAITANNGARYDGWNYPNSRARLWIDLQSSDGTRWVNRETALMSIGSTASGVSTLSGALLWRVQLNPQWAATDCIGRGTVSNR